MCKGRLKGFLGIGCLAFGTGILLTYLFRGVLLIIAQAVALTAVGIFLLKNR